MHELSIAQNIIGIAERRREEIGAGRIKIVRVKIGAFTAVDADSLKQCFSMVAQSTDADGAELVVEITPLAAECSACGAPFEPENLTFRCPGCGSPEVKITSGRELYVDSIEVE